MTSLNKIITTLVVAPLFFTMFSCSSGDSIGNVIDIDIDIDNAKAETLLMSDYFESIDYIPLETSEKSLIGRLQHVHVTDEFILTVSSGTCHIFDRKTGVFLRQIGREGNGPNEYMSLLHGDGVNSKKNTILAAKATGLIEYSLADGSVVEPTIKASIPIPFSGKYMNIENDIWVKGSLNATGDLTNQLVYFDRKKVTDSIANTSFFARKSNSSSMNLGEILFYRYNDNVYYKFLYTDTIFDISNKKLEPKWILKTQRPMSEIADLRADIPAMNKETSNYHYIYYIHETDNYLLFNSGYQKENVLFLFSKNNKQLIKVENDGFVNDIDGGLTFWPTYTTSNQDAVTVYQAHKFLEEIDTTKASDQLKSLVSGIKEDDNPVIMIAKPKK